MVTKAIVKLHRAGNSLTITVPKNLLATLNWKEGDYILLEIRREEEGKTVYDYAGRWILKAEKIEETK